MGFLDTLVALVLRRRRLDTYIHLEWGANETLTVQRLAHEELGLGRWKRCDGPLPVAEKGYLLGVLDFEGEGPCEVEGASGGVGGGGRGCGCGGEARGVRERRGKCVK